MQKKNETINELRRVIWWMLKEGRRNPDVVEDTEEARKDLS